MYKVAILYICTGRYSTFWRNFFDMTEKNFLLNSEKHYYVFTDDNEILSTVSERIHPYYQQVEKWPFPTLRRFSYFLQVKEGLKKYDYLIFMNANLIVNMKISEEEILPLEDQKLFVTLHPGPFDRSPFEFEYDRNPYCTAYIPEGEGRYYFAGGLNGGRAKDYIRMIEILAGNIERDLEKDVIPLWHDESQLNRYMYEYKEKYKIISPAYLYPEEKRLPFEKKIIVLDKNRKGGHSFFRGIIG